MFEGEPDPERDENGAGETVERAPNAGAPKHARTVADHEGVKSGISTHLEFSVVLIDAVLLIGFAIPLWAKRVNQFPDSSAPARSPSAWRRKLS